MNNNEGLKILDYSNNILKAVIYKDGRLFFNIDTSDILNLSKEKFILLGESIKHNEFYLSICTNKRRESFPIRRTNGLYYVQIKAFLIDKNIDYKNQKVIFELQRFQEYDKNLDGEVYKINMKAQTKPFRFESLKLNTEKITIDSCK